MLGAASWAAYAGVAWLRYGQAKRNTRPEETDPLLDLFMPTYEVVEGHWVRVAAPAEITLSAAAGMDLQQSPVIRAILRRYWAFLSPGILWIRRISLRMVKEEAERIRI